IAGGKLTYEYCLFDETSNDDIFSHSRCELFVFTNILYNTNAILSNGQIRMEKQVKPESVVDYTSLKFQTVESYTGFGLKIKINERLKWVNAIGIGGWVTINGK